MTLASVFRRSFAADQSALLEIAQQAAEISCVEVKRAADVACCQAVAMRELVENTHLAERIGAIEIGFSQHADLLRIEPIESADRGDCLLACHRR